MTQEEDIEDDNGSVTSQELVPIPSVLSKKNATSNKSSAFSNCSSSSSFPLPTSRPVTRPTASRFNSSKWHSKIGAKKKPQRPKISKMAVKVQVGALVKKRMRVTIDGKRQMAMVFGTVVQKIWAGQWHIKFQND